MTESDDDPWALDEAEIALNPAVTAARKGFLRRRRKGSEPPKGNTKTTDARATRDSVIRQAQGRDRKEPEQWREDLKAGERGKAQAALASKSFTHNAGSGFGLAQRNWWDD